MQFKIKDLPKVELPGIVYSLYWFDEPTDQDIMALINACRRYEKKFPEVSWFVSVSDTESGSSVRYSEKTGKRGRPKIKVDGKKIGKHIHQGALSGSNKRGESAKAFQTEISRVINKRVGRKVTKIQSMANKGMMTKGAPYITYAYQQANSFYSGGDYDFSQCKDDFYLEVI